ncbi:MAG TPA: HAMP domain-containing sensor histidine kinase [Armatimonadota bacterium]|nr:HAMP domain-containing sensor histidine kinase [Armatimonadota bacterium]
MESHSSVTREAGLSHDWFNNTILAHVTTALIRAAGHDEAFSVLRQIAMFLGSTIDQCYRTNIDYPLSYGEFTAFLAEVRDRYALPMSIGTPNMDEIIVDLQQNALAEKCGDVLGYYYIISSIVGTLAARNFGYARIVMDESPVDGETDSCRLHIQLNPTRTDNDEHGEEFTCGDIAQVINTHGIPAPQGDWSLPGALQRDLLQSNYETLYHRQLELNHRLEQALAMERAAAEQLRMFNRIKQDFLSNVSHEFRTPITAIQGYLSLLEQGALGDLLPEQLESVRVALRNLDRLNSLVNDVLDFSSISRGQFLLQGKPVEIADVISQALSHVDEISRNKQISILNKSQGPVGCVLGDHEKLTQVIEHVLENAVKFSNPGDSVTLSTHCQQQNVIVEVRDSGIGMTSEQLEHVFTPFVQGESGLSRRHGGLGMGLSLISNLVSLHGGRINIWSKPDCGTTVRVTLPLMKDEK